jgi:glycerate kinase
MRRVAPDSLNASPLAVCAPNAFKGTLTARAAARSLALGVADAGFAAMEVPVADGGDGTLDVLLASRPGASTTRHRVCGPNSESITARLGRLDRTTAVVELAEASGLRRVTPQRHDAMHATSRGTGDLIRFALDAGCRRIIVGVGGSACTDGGAGLLQAVGVSLTDSRGVEIGPGGAGLEALVAIDLSAAHPGLEHCSIEVACDVRSPLLGDGGAARVFAAQKGANETEIERLERALEHLAAIAQEGGDGNLAEHPGAGAAGGCGFGLALLGARLVPGAGLICDLVGLEAALSGAAIAITGEGRLDAQTATGKAPAEVAARARVRSIPTVAICGQVLDALPDLFRAAVALDSIDPDVDPMRHTRALLRQAAARAVRDVLGGRPQ